MPRHCLFIQHAQVVFHGFQESWLTALVVGRVVCGAQNLLHLFCSLYGQGHPFLGFKSFILLWGWRDHAIITDCGGLNQFILNVQFRKSRGNSRALLRRVLLLGWRAGYLSSFVVQWGLRNVIEVLLAGNFQDGFRVSSVFY